MQSFQLTDSPAQGPKNYVFVDEHNRHKRLKVMRACEGCRRRKIKCDAATTNTWPCAACKRLKLTCVPPVGGTDGDPNNNDPNVDQFDSPANDANRQYLPGSYVQFNGYETQPELNHNFHPYSIQQQPQYSHNDYSQHPHHLMPHDPARLFAQQPMDAQRRYPSFDSSNGQLAPNTVHSPQSTDSITAEELAENLGDLKIPDSGVAPYIRQQSGSRSEAPAPILDDEDDLPAFSTVAGSQIRIPPALMPTEEEAMSAFNDFFHHVHPYVPVLCRSQFIRQWETDRDTISPLLLEAVLACAGQVSDDPAGGSQWLALANRHEENFADSPRLSTIQALLLLMKARERNPKRGYYYRSWITVKKIVGMAKDLDLNEHSDSHENDLQCGSTPEECLVKTRVWQSAMILELMVGGPQGRYDFGVDLDTVDLSPSPPSSDIDTYEREVSRQFTCWVRNVRNIRGMTEVYHKLKRKNKDWASDPQFVAYGQDFKKWPDDLPPDLKMLVTFDGCQPRLQSHYLANMHCHYQLGIVMLYKPQLTASKDFANDDIWKYIMSTCYSAAKRVCIIQEAILANYDILGLASMLRGLSFPIYAILSCVMVHLVAITSPDPEINRDAKEFFVRHMRLLERCIEDWPMPEVETQIHGLRAAFSVNLRKPFELKPSFPYGTPSEHGKSPETRRSSEPQQSFQPGHNPQQYPGGFHADSYYATPPISDNLQNPHHEQQLFQEYHPNSSVSHYQHLSDSNVNALMTPTDSWNPTPIIDQFNTAFAIPQSALAPPPPSTSYGSSPPGALSQQNIHTQMHNQHYMSPAVTGVAFNPQQSYQPSPTSQPMANPQGYPIQTQKTPQPQLTPSHYPQHQAVNSYFDVPPKQSMSHPAQQVQTNQGYAAVTNGNSQYASSTDAGSINAPIYVTPKEWQRSVASVYDTGTKRKWDHDHQLAIQHGQALSGYGRTG